MALDGEMPAEEREDYRRWRDRRPDMKAMAEQFAADRAVLRSVLEPDHEPVPERFANLLSSGREREVTGNRLGVPPWPLR